MDNEDGQRTSSQRHKKKDSRNVENAVPERKSKNELTLEKGFFWNEVLEGKDNVIVAKDALITQLYQTIKLLEEKVEYLNEKLHVNQIQDLNSRTFSQVVKVTKNTGNHEDSAKAEIRPEVNYYNENCVFIKPNKKQDTRKTKEEIMKYVDPKDLKVGIQKVFNLRDGGVKIQYKNKEDLENFKRAATEKMGNSYELKTLNKKAPKIKIIGLEQNYSKEALTECIRSQNNTIQENSKIEIIVVKKMKTKYMAIIELDPNSFKSVMESGVLIIDLTVCTVFEHIDLLRCFKCTGYHHTNKFCRNSSSLCIRCGLDGHLANNCFTDEKDFCCPNCSEVNKNYQQNFSINHGPFNRECGIFKKKAEIEKRRIAYE